ncbi:hypothetical protein CRE_01162 [Caenorhabditis remanei]|uniref:Lin-15A/B-like domain-containing protein n=1 Tax=Caenorhabditis remanei TaxID=31234 RepID=E3MWK1_CAERE|nr:hypothetical protein CRE_01162 [Caenorhabditis remanei]
MENVENVDNSESFMIKVRLLEFLKDNGIPFPVVDNAKFHSFVDFLKPGVALPTSEELIKFNSNCYPKHKEQQDKFKEDNSEAPASENHVEHFFSGGKSSTYILQETKPEFLTLSGNPEKPQLGTSSSNNQDNFMKSETSKTASKFMNLESIPGYASTPCIVCLERKQTSEVRLVRTNDAYIMIFICVKNELYSMDDAKEIAKLPKFQCCAIHLDDMYRDALDHLGVVDPEIDVHTDNARIMEANHLVRELRSARANRVIMKQTHVHYFLRYIKKFLENYARHNYIAASKELYYPPVPTNSRSP